VPRNEDIEKILAAWYRLKTSLDKHKAAAAASLNRLLDDARTGSNLSRAELLEALRPRFDEYYKQKVREENTFRRNR
jgi:hypothetical protein